MEDKYYEASEELVRILLKNGFRDITNQFYPSHIERMEQDGYNPQSHKRVFAISKSDHLKFNYTQIEAFYRGCTGSDMKYKLTVDELKSIIAFYKLPPQSKSYIYSKSRDSITSLYTYYDTICEYPRFCKRKSDLGFKKLFETVQII